MYILELFSKSGWYPIAYVNERSGAQGLVRWYEARGETPRAKETPQPVAANEAWPVVELRVRNGWAPVARVKELSGAKALSRWYEDRGDIARAREESVHVSAR